MLKASVILCTHNPRGDYLRRVLEGLQNQSLPYEQWELLLIDNCSKTPVSAGFDISWHPKGRHLREDTPGLTPARSRGIRETSSDLLIFVDDDTVLARDYLEQALVVAQQWPFIGAWGGSIIPEYEIPLPYWVGHHEWRLTAVSVSEDVWSNLREGFSTYPAGAGMCLRRQVAARYIQWCETMGASRSLDRTGSSLAGYGDMDMCQCAIDVGLGTGRSTKLNLTHLVPASRLTLDYFVRHAEGDACSLLVYRALRGLPYRHLAYHTWFKAIVWRLHCLRRRIPWQQQQIHAAHLRGLRKGLQLADRILKPSD